MTQPYTITQSTVMAAAGIIASLLIALVPSWAPYKQTLIAALGGLLSLGFLFANAIHVHALATKTRREAAVQVAGPATVIPTRPASTSSPTKGVSDA